MLLFFINTNSPNSHTLTSGKLGTVPEISLEAEPHSSKMVAHDVRDKLKIYYYYIMSPEKTSKYIFEKAVEGGSFTYPFI